MDQEMMTQVEQTLCQFRMPRYHEIPDVGLYLEQVVKYINDALSPMAQAEMTGSMISNYVKKGLISSPVKKQYDREQIAHLMFIALAKSVVSLDNLCLFIRLQKQTYPAERAYNYLCEEFENLLAYVFGIKDSIAQVGVDSTDEKMMLRSTIITVVHKIYLDKCFDALALENE